MDSMPRPGTVVYDLVYGTTKQQKKAIKKFHFVNTYCVIPFYRIGLLPLLGFSRIFLLLITIGRKTGKKRITPLEYHRIKDIIHIISARGDRADWFKLASYSIAATVNLIVLPNFTNYEFIRFYFIGT